MKAAIAADDGRVSEHFGRCDKYVIFEVENGEVADKREVKNPGHKPGFLPKFLKGKGVNMVIAGGIGPRAIQLFESYGIKVVSPVSGSVEDVMTDFCQGKLKDGVKPCGQ